MSSCQARRPDPSPSREPRNPGRRDIDDDAVRSTDWHHWHGSRRLDGSRRRPDGCHWTWANLSPLCWPGHLGRESRDCPWHLGLDRDTAPSGFAQCQSVTVRPVTPMQA